MFSIGRNGKLVSTGMYPVAHANTTKKSSGKLNPKFIVIHYTAGTSYEGDVRTLSTSPSQVSCHLVLGPEGQVTQIGNFDDVLWHAGTSSWKGYTGLNRYSIGIEVTCPGPLDDQNRTWTGTKLTDGKPWPIIRDSHKNERVVRSWARFTEHQIKSLTELCYALQEAFPSIEEVVGHDDISPGRKIDPGPSCPASFFSLVNGNRFDGPDGEATEIIETLKSSGIFKKVAGVAPSNLNFRDGPNGNIIGFIPENTYLEVISTSGEWSRVQTPNGHKGWVASRYLQ